MPTALQQIGIVLAALALLPLILKLLVKLRLWPLLLYTLLAGTVFVGWAETHRTLSMAIFFGILALVALSWLVTLRRNIAENRRMEQDLLRRATPLYDLADMTEDR